MSLRLSKFLLYYRTISFVMPLNVTSFAFSLNFTKTLHTSFQPLRFFPSFGLRHNGVLDDLIQITGFYVYFWFLLHLVVQEFHQLQFFQYFLFLDLKPQFHTHNVPSMPCYYDKNSYSITSYY